MSARDVLAAYFGRHTTDTDTQLIAADAILSALDAAGYAVVPTMPTEAMLMAIGMFRVESTDGSPLSDYYAKMNDDFRSGALTRYAAVLTAAKETP